MIGRAPMMAQPTYAPSFPAESYPQPVYQQPTWQPAASAWPDAAPAEPAPVQQAQAMPATRRPIFRGQAPDEQESSVGIRTPSTPLTLPSPEQLGIAGTDAANGIDWVSTHRRLDQLGAVGFHLARTPEGGYRFTCLMPTGQSGRTHHVDAVAATEAEVVRLALDKSEEWAGSR